MQHVGSNAESYLITMNTGVASQDISQLGDYLETQSDQIRNAKLVKGTEAVKYFDVDPKLFSDSDIDFKSIYPDHYIIELVSGEGNSKNAIIDTITAMSGITDISIIRSDSTLGVMNVSGAQQLSMTSMILLMILILAVIYIGLSLDFQRNRDSLKSLIMKGATQKYLMGTYQKKGLVLSIKTWIGGLALFFLSFYLLRFDTYSDISIFEFKFLGIVCLVPLALIIFITSFVIYTKIMTLIRE